MCCICICCQGAAASGEQCKRLPHGCTVHPPLPPLDRGVPGGTDAVPVRPTSRSQSTFSEGVGRGQSALGRGETGPAQVSGVSSECVCGGGGLGGREREGRCYTAGKSRYTSIHMWAVVMMTLCPHLLVRTLLHFLFAHLLFCPHACFTVTGGGMYTYVHTCVCEFC